MTRFLGGILGLIVRLVLIAAILSVLVSAAVTFGVIDVGDDGSSLEQSDRDWPFVWEVPIDGDPAVETDPGHAGDEEEYGAPIEEDPGTTTVAIQGETITSDAIEARIHVRVNDIRSSHELSPLGHDDDIASIARTHSHDMAERGYIGHVTPEGVRPHDRFGDLFPAECRGVGENIAMVGQGGATDADALAKRIVDGWMNSDSHRENLLTEEWDREGIGVYLHDGAVFATQNFCDDSAG